MHLQELKSKDAAELLAYAEELEIENASTLRTQDMMFAILKQLADNDVVIRGTTGTDVSTDYTVTINVGTGVGAWVVTTASEAASIETPRILLPVNESTGIVPPTDGSGSCVRTVGLGLGALFSLALAKLLSAVRV